MSESAGGWRPLRPLISLAGAALGVSGVFIVLFQRRFRLDEWVIAAHLTLVLVGLVESALIAGAFGTRSKRLRAPMWPIVAFIAALGAVDLIMWWARSIWLNDLADVSLRSIASYLVYFWR